MAEDRSRLCCMLQDKWDLAGFPNTALAPELHMSDVAWSQTIAVQKPPVGVVGCGLSRSDQSLCVSVSLRVLWWGWGRVSARLGPLVEEPQLHPRAALPVLRQWRAANAEFRPQTAVL